MTPAAEASEECTVTGCERDKLVVCREVASAGGVVEATAMIKAVIGSEELPGVQNTRQAERQSQHGDSQSTPHSADLLLTSPAIF